MKAIILGTSQIWTPLLNKAFEESYVDIIKDMFLCYSAISNICANVGNKKKELSLYRNNEFILVDNV